MKSLLRILLTTVLLSVIAVPLGAAASVQPFVDPTNPDGNLIFDQNVTSAVYQGEDGFYFRTAYTFADGSVGVFATNTLERPLPPDDNEVVTPEKLWKTLPNDQLYRFDQEGRLLERIMIPAGIEHPYQLKGPRNIARSSNGTYWAIRQGTFSDKICSNRAGCGIRDLLSHEIFSFDAKGTTRTIDVNDFLPEVTTPIISNITLNNDKLLVFIGDKVLIFDALNGTLLGKVVNGMPYESPVPLRDGGIGFFNGQEGKLYKFSGSFPDTLTPEKANSILDISDINPVLKPMNHSILSIVGTDQLAYDNQGITTVLQPDKAEPVITQVVQPFLFASYCVNCPKQLFSKLLSGTKQLLISESSIQAQDLHPIRATMNGELIVLNSPVYYDQNDGHVWLPLRETAEAIGAKVDYDRENRSISLKRGGLEAIIHQDRPEIEMKTMINYGKAYVSIRALAELLGIEITWNQTTYTVELAKR
ncbi:copper amine oxidase N-terminal domain-containing protein [Paenibacillus sedimenti]|uniref:Copper amine oxidase N-terminal domain-containing protein n=1 Tax=Paenibacillus sedimenti TaxID=2770274 RepID=A0A926KLD1_9BACL|nr:copper amine oxidase N-terminal domain-containing protein [Paenibacillus sedimenti]MBD0379417.1 copper amine oxidase N-terminal domain-containing protein [Paenibacillus sedimenti]